MNNGRDHRIDFFRGLALIFIFWDHVPDNPLAQLTVRNFGFSDAAEIFVFLAGYAAIMAYGRIARRDGMLVAGVRILRRTWVLYVVHIFLLTLLMGIVFVANNHVETRDMVQQMGLEYFVGNPQQALADELLLRFKPNLTDPLPLYIVLLLTLPLTLPLMLRKLEVAVGLSIALYLMVPLFGWNLRAYEGGGVWYFNPVAWQLLFILGGACALRSETAKPVQAPPLRQQPLFLMAAAYVLIAGVLTFSENGPTCTPRWSRPCTSTPSTPSAKPTWHPRACCTSSPWSTWLPGCCQPQAPGSRTGPPARPAAWAVIRWKSSAWAYCSRHWQTWQMRWPAIRGQCRSLQRLSGWA